MNKYFKYLIVFPIMTTGIALVLSIIAGQLSAHGANPVPFLIGGAATAMTIAILNRDERRACK